MRNNKTNIYGDLKMVPAFPWMNQQCDFSVCAHVAVWFIIRCWAVVSGRRPPAGRGPVRHDQQKPGRGELLRQR